MCMCIYIMQGVLYPLEASSQLRMQDRGTRYKDGYRNIKLVNDHDYSIPIVIGSLNAKTLSDWLTLEGKADLYSPSPHIMYAPSKFRNEAVIIQ